MTAYVLCRINAFISNSSCEDSESDLLYKPKLDNIRIKSMREAGASDFHSFDRDVSNSALHKISLNRPFSPELFVQASRSKEQVPLTKSYLAAANRNLAVSTLRLWQSDGTKRKTKSVYNLQDCMVQNKKCLMMMASVSLMSISEKRVFTKKLQNVMVVPGNIFAKCHEIAEKEKLIQSPLAHGHLCISCLSGNYKSGSNSEENFFSITSVN